MNPNKIGICHKCRKEGDRTPKPLIWNLCYLEEPYHHQKRHDEKVSVQLEKQKVKQEEKRRSLYIELPSGEQGTLQGKEIPVKKAYKIKPVSDKQSKRLREYEKQKAIHFEEFPTCQFPGCCRTDVQLHHMGGRIGSMLTDRRYFKSLCDEHHKWVELHPIEAKEMGLSISRLSKAS